MAKNAISKSKQALKKVLLSPLLAGMIVSSPGTVRGMPAPGPCLSSLISVTILTEPMHFGSILPCTAAAGVVRLRGNTGNITTSGCIDGTFGTAVRGRFRVRGNQASNANRVLVQIDNTVTISAGANTMSLTRMSIRPGGVDGSHDFGGRRTRTYNVGGRDNVDGGQAEGTYTGTFNVNATCL